MWILRGIVVLQATASTERGDAHPQQAFTIIHSRLLKYGKREKKKNRKRKQMLKLNWKKGQRNVRTPYAVIRESQNPLGFSSHSPCAALGLWGGSPSTPATAPSLHHHYTLPKLPSCNVRFDLSLGRPCKTNNGRC